MGHDRLERLHVNSASLSVTLRTLGFLQHSDLDTTLDNIFAHQGRRSIAREEDLEFQPALRFEFSAQLHIVLTAFNHNRPLAMRLVSFLGPTT